MATTAESGFTATEMFVEVVPSRGWRGALVTSALLHLVLVALLLQLRIGSGETSVQPELRPRITVVIVPRVPVSTADPADPTGTVPPDAATTDVPSSTRMSSAQPDASVQEQALSTSVAPGVTEGMTLLPPRTARPEQPRQTLTQEAIRASIANFSTVYKQQLRADWLSQCMRYRERYVTPECPQQQPGETSALDEGREVAATVFAAVTRVDRHRRLTAALLEENTRLETTMEAGGVLGGLARERHFLNREYAFYLNGNFNFGAWNFVRMSNAGNGNLEFMGNYLQFQCKEAPCIYEFTGIGAKTASPRTAEPSTSDETNRIRSEPTSHR